MRIISFLPGATEMVCALGLEKQLVGITHECDYPPGVRDRPVVVRTRIRMEDLSPEAVDATVRQTLHSGEGLYRVDETLLKSLAPDLVLTQDLCPVCAPSGQSVAQFLEGLDPRPRVVSLVPRSLSGVFENLRQVGEATGCLEEAEQLIRGFQERIRVVTDRTRALPERPRVACLEWLSPLYSAGHWMPELVELAGGLDVLADQGRDSERLDWTRLLTADPEVLILGPCGWRRDRVLGEAHRLTRFPGWQEIEAVRKGRVYAVDAHSYFARPGPRIIEGLELLAALIHPGHFRWQGPADAWGPVVLETPDQTSPGPGSTPMRF